ncbi:cell division protein FtsQ/DivIB [Sedimenticola selenatireducens]|uniref:Cell division protein FtsQ n=1 Tax=Sedimenticola selenatireducens TaxID=191960 RepID=A0A2N6CXK7_9GAMM|nr:cell division protein FtsQ/DivIB [Sedimenticola selenatireducens]PLX62034.1 MAG: cell division protein FtsQ [Sedimenticola selenatireducens]
MAMEPRKTTQKAEAAAGAGMLQRLLHWLTVLGVLLLFAGGGVWGVITLRDPAVLQLKLVRIDGELRNLDRRELEQAVGAVVDGNFFTVDLDAVRAAALKLAWVDQVTVRRIWPDTLNMWVEEQQQLARWGDSQLVNGRGGVFTPESEALKTELPSLAGPADSATEIVARYQRMGSRFAALKLDIDRLVMDGRGAWTVGFKQGMELKLGHTDTEARVDRFVRLYPMLEQAEKRRVKRVDMRYANGVAVLWGEAS